jgi:hypothetical protein
MRKDSEVPVTERLSNAEGRGPQASAAEGWVRPKFVNLTAGKTELDSYLTYTYGDPQIQLKIDDGMLEEFLNLSFEAHECTIHPRIEPKEYDERVAQRVLNYAKKWGALLGMPQVVDHCAPPGLFDAMLAPKQESVRDWRLFASKAKAMLLVAAEPDDKRDRTVKRDKISSFLPELNSWMGVIQPVIESCDGQYTIRLNAGNLLSALAIQIAVTIAHSEGIGVCGYCGELFWVKGNRKTYCGKHGKVAGRRFAARKRDAEKREARQCHRQGLSPKETSMKLKVSEERIDRMFKGFNRSGAKADQRGDLENKTPADIGPSTELG